VSGGGGGVGEWGGGEDGVEGGDVGKIGGDRAGGGMYGIEGVMKGRRSDVGGGEW